MNVIFFGTPQFAQPTLEKLLDDPRFTVQAVVTQPDKRRGRGKQLSPSPIKQVAIAHQLPVWQPVRIKKDAETIEKLQQANADVFVVVAYGQILSQEILDLPRYGCINVHGSLLPAYRGAAPIQWSLYNGDAVTGIATMQMEAGMDTGPVLLDRELEVGLLETAHDLAIELSQAGAELLIETLLQIETLQPKPQDESLATYAPLIQKSDYEIDWTKPAIAIHNQVRGFYPNCTATIRDRAVKLIATVPLGSAYWDRLPESLQGLQQTWISWQAAAREASPGEVVALVKGHGPVVKTGEDLLLLHSIKPAGKRAQSGWDFANGLRLEVGEIFESG